MDRRRAILAACALLAATRAAQAAAPPRGARMPRQQAAIVEALQGVLRGPEILPNGAGVQVTGTTGVLRTLELDDTTSLHLRVHIPF